MEYLKMTDFDKEYDGVSRVKLRSAGILVGVIGGDDVTLNATQAAGAFANADLGTGKTVTISGLTISGADAGNYTLTQPTTTATITAKGLTVSGITASDKDYDGTTSATLVSTSTASLIGVIGDDEVTLNVTQAAGAFAKADVGTGKTVTISGLTISGADAGNYTLTHPTTKASIRAKELTVSGIIAPLIATVNIAIAIPKLLNATL